MTNTHEAPAAAPSTAAMAGTAAIQIPPFTLGTHYPEQGGVYAGMMRPKGRAGDHWHLFVPIGPDVELGDLTYGPSIRVGGAEDDNDGLQNTLALIASSQDHPAARVCREFTHAGHADWYLPARNELRLAYTNVPELFETDDWYWSSTQYAGFSFNAWAQSFNYGGQDDFHKYGKLRVRAVRRLVIQSFSPSAEAAEVAA